MFFKANAVTRYATANKEKTGHVDLNFGLKKWAFFTSVSYTDFDNLRMGSNGPEDYIRPEYVETVDGVDVIEHGHGKEGEHLSCCETQTGR